MANVILDQNGIPKGPVFESTAPLQHRSAITVVDAADPADASGAVDSAGSQFCRFDLNLSGSGLVSLEVQVLFWNSRLSQWFGGGKRQLTEIGHHSLLVETRGAMVFLKVITFSGTSFNLSADYALS